MAPRRIPGYETASPTMRLVLDHLAGLRWIGPGRWIARCPCCDVDGAAEVADLWQGGRLDPRGSVQ